MAIAPKLATAAARCRPQGSMFMPRRIYSSNPDGIMRLLLQNSPRRQPRANRGTSCVRGFVRSHRGSVSPNKTSNAVRESAKTFLAPHFIGECFDLLPSEGSKTFCRESFGGVDPFTKGSTKKSASPFPKGSKKRVPFPKGPLKPRFHYCAFFFFSSMPQSIQMGK